MGVPGTSRGNARKAGAKAGARKVEERSSAKDMGGQRKAKVREDMEDLQTDRHHRCPQVNKYPDLQAYRSLSKIKVELLFHHLKMLTQERTRVVMN